MVHASIIGARGYLGRELVRLLSGHPQVEDVLPVSTTEAGSPLGDSVPALRHLDLTFHDPAEAAVRDADVVFLATPPGEAASFAAQAVENGARLVVDLSRDHRVPALKGQNGWTYGLADVMPVARGTRLVANPGCYPTASLIAMAPALRERLVGDGPIIVDGKSGVSGAGVAPRADLHFPEMNESVRAYKVLGHDHGTEIALGATLLNGRAHKVRFTPHLVPQTRGLLATVYLPAREGVTQEDLQDAYTAAYASSPREAGPTPRAVGSPTSGAALVTATAHTGSAAVSSFIRFGGEPSTSHVRLSNFCDVAVDLDTETGIVVARGAIDNLVKGGAGTAVQNMNMALGWRADAGLTGTGGGL